MKLFTTIAAATIALTGFAAPEAKALPIWAELVAQSNCEYLAMGATTSEAMRQAILDNNLWAKEMNAAGRLAGKAIGAATVRLCLGLVEKAYEQQSAQPARYQESLMRRVDGTVHAPGCTDASVGPATRRVMGCS